MGKKNKTRRKYKNTTKIPDQEFKEAAFSLQTEVEEMRKSRLSVNKLYRLREIIG